MAPSQLAARNTSPEISNKLKELKNYNDNKFQELLICTKTRRRGLVRSKVRGHSEVLTFDTRF